jgi:GTPase SAR1 family protein
MVVTKKLSFENAEKWIQINEKANPPLRVLVGNKVDLYSTTKNTVAKADAVALAKKYGM